MATIGTRIGLPSRIVRGAIALTAIGLLTASIGAGTVMADSGRSTHAATFTKWVTDWPNMAGVVGGSVGDGAFSGKVLDYDPGPTTVIAALYHFGGSRHAFTALMHVEQTGLHAVLVGVVIDGWGKGKLVTRRVHPDHLRPRWDHDRLLPWVARLRSRLTGD